MPSFTANLNLTLYDRVTDNNVKFIDFRDALVGVSASNMTKIDAGFALKANITSPTFAGTPSGPTAIQGTNTTQLATTAFVNAEIAADAAPLGHVGATGTAHGPVTTSVNGFMISTDKTKLDGIAAGAQVNPTFTATATDIKMNGTQSVGALATIARADHVHPVDTSRQPLGNELTALQALADTAGFLKKTGDGAYTIDTATYNNYVHPNHSGDVTSTADGATVIGANKVTNAILADVATGTLKGRVTALTGDPEDLTPEQVRTLLNVADGAQANVAANLAQGTRTTTTVPVTSSTGTAATLDIATTSLAGMMASADKTKLDGIATGAQVNPTFTATATDIKMNGTQSVGALATIARADHVHPVDTSRAPIASPTFTGTVGGVTATMVGLGNVTNESKSTMLTSAALTGTPTAPTAAINTNTTQVATTAFVNAEIATDATPISHIGSTGAAHGNATNLVSGFMSSIDKNRLDSLLTSTYNYLFSSTQIIQSQNVIVSNRTIDTDLNANYLLNKLLFLKFKTA